MNEAPPLHCCPRCGSEETPTLIMRQATLTNRGASWRCHSCRHSWSEPRDRTLVSR
jgi:transposase-like protein